jgi:uncharacterized cupin superfamily protein
MIEEAALERTEHGLVPTGRGWFVLNACDARWWKRAERWKEASLMGRGDFPQVGLGLTVLEPGEPLAMYHWEADQEDFLILAGEALAIVEGEERPLRRWDFVHCPPGTRHTIVGAGHGPCVVFAVGALEHHTTGSRVEGTQEGREGRSGYTVDETAMRHGAGVEEETEDASVAYARFPELQSTTYREDWLP